MALTDSEAEKLAELIQTQPEDPLPDLIESYPGVILRIETQFSGAHWYPKVADDYVDAISNIEHVMRNYVCPDDFALSSGLRQGLDMTPVNVNVATVPIEYIKKCFPDMSSMDMDRLADLFDSWNPDSVAPDYEKDEEDFFADVFTILASTRYCYYVAREADIEELLTFWYQPRRYSEKDIRGTILPRYLEVQREYQDAYAEWRNSW